MDCHLCRIGRMKIKHNEKEFCELFVNARTRAAMVHPSLVILSWALPQQQLTLMVLMNYVSS